ncbi:hypothetical protein THRCLA_22252 [Thraustotheca clavata]|uniref:Uncharacterized protein n=1 Tax=Thraustotheca clavata TaxID=74557 RepID=A0A1V9Z813_9STRA|nr:hypothetical protein THRCLA_22252 [Thraustotheca clavata]
MQPTRPLGGKKTAVSIKSARDGTEKLPRLNTREVEIHGLILKPPPEENTEGDDEEKRVQGYDLQYCESMLVAIEKESTQNGHRYLTMLEFKEGKDPFLMNMQTSFRSITQELKQLEELCAQGWDTDEIDAALLSIPAQVVALEEHRWKME